jgi:hypothetical protein
MSYLRYLCLFTYTGVQHILCCVFLRLVSCVPYVANFSGLSIFDCRFGILLYSNKETTLMHTCVCY